MCGTKKKCRVPFGESKDAADIGYQIAQLPVFVNSIGCFRYGNDCNPDRQQALIPNRHQYRCPERQAYSKFKMPVEQPGSRPVMAIDTAGGLPLF